MSKLGREKIKGSPNKWRAYFHAIERCEVSAVARPRKVGPMTRTSAPSRKDFKHFLKIPTRWADVDVYGHVNNIVYYSYFDTAVSEHLVSAGGLHATESPVIGVVVETKCEFRKEINFPATIDAGIRVFRLGTSSASYNIGLFIEGEETPAAFGHFVHVYINRESRRPESIPERIRSALNTLV